ncbi:hypothetical protein OPIT5_10580 [Opitutaceae bacterium TAV5]|nr:hypothetical protein OPIT5_10580 [Opitutaceae bacterium TAV5]
MQRLLPFVACLVLAALLAAPFVAQATTSAAGPAPSASPPLSGNAVAPSNPQALIGPVATQIAAITGIAISPLLGTGAYGAYHWWQAKTPAQKAALPWYASPWFWLPALLVAAACAAKDAAGAALPPGLKKPADVLETIENKISGLVAAGAVIPMLVSGLSALLATSAPDAAGTAAAATSAVASHATLAAHGLATLPGVTAAFDGSWLLHMAVLPLGIAAFVVVWMASHAINVLILLSPWGAIDAGLKTARTTLLGAVVLVPAINPWAGLILSLGVIFVAWLVAGWSFRLTVFGTLFSWDFFTLRRLRFYPQPLANRMFSSALLKRVGVPMRSYGRLFNEPENGRIVFAWRPWLVMPLRRVEVRVDNPAVARGLFFSTISNGRDTALILPPRYRGHEEAIAEIYAFEGGVQEAGLLRAWSSLRELFGGSAARTQIGG